MAKKFKVSLAYDHAQMVNKEFRKKPLNKAYLSMRD